MNLPKVPSPRCCADVGKFVSLLFSEEAMHGSRGQDGHVPRWTINGMPVLFCPFCGTKLPSVRRKVPPPTQVCVVTDGGYYCDTCGERLLCCRCAPPEAAFTIEDP